MLFSKWVPLLGMAFAMTQLSVVVRAPANGVNCCGQLIGVIAQCVMALEYLFLVIGKIFINPALSRFGARLIGLLAPLISPQSLRLSLVGPVSLVGHLLKNPGQGLFLERMG